MELVRDHEIDPELDCPARTIIVQNVLYIKSQQPNKKKIAVTLTNGDSEYSSKKYVLKSKKGVEKSSTIKPEGSSKKIAEPSLSEHSSKKSFLKSKEGAEKSSTIKAEGSFKRRAEPSSYPESFKKKKVADTSKNPLRRKLSTEVKRPGQPTLGSRLFDFYNEAASNKLEKDNTSVDDYKQIVVAKSQQTEILPPLDDESKQRYSFVSLFSPYYLLKKTCKMGQTG